MSSAQIERDLSAASLVLPSNRGSMDARYFQAQLCALVNFLHLVHRVAEDAPCIGLA